MSSGMPPGEDYQTHRTSSDSPESAPPAFVTPVHGRSYAESLTPVVVSAPPKRRRFPHPSPLLVGIASLLILAACFGGWLGGYEYFAIQNQSDAPATALQQFCAAEARQDYVAAFQLMTPAFRQQFSASDWTQSQVQRDQTYGVVRGCSGISRNLSYGLGQTHAALDVTVTYAHSTQRGHVVLQFGTAGPGFGFSYLKDLNNSSLWFIDQMDATFRLGG